MSTARFRIDIDADDFDAMNFHALRSRGHNSTSSDATIQHATIKINPLRNEPVRWLRSPMILGPRNPPMLAVQLMKPTAAAAAELVRNEDESAQNAKTGAPFDVALSN